MADGSGSESLARRLRNDHELFLEEYEKPTQIYRFLKGRHSLKPLFLQRNLSYMWHGRRKKRNTGSRSPAKLDTISERTKRRRKPDLATQIHSDNQLQINFNVIEKQPDWSNVASAGTVVKPTCGEDIVSSDSVMQVEVLLCYFKQPSAEALLASNSSLPIHSTSLGSFSVRYCSQSSRPVASSPRTLNIPASWLSWRGTQDTFGTHMLVFRATIPDTSEKSTSAKKTKRKRDLSREMSRRQAQCIVEDCRMRKDVTMHGSNDVGRVKVITSVPHHRPKRVASSVQLPSKDVYHSPVASPTYPLSNGFTDMAAQQQHNKVKETRDFGVMTDVSLGTKDVEMTFSPLKLSRPQPQSQKVPTKTNDNPKPVKRPLASNAVAKKSGMPIFPGNGTMSANTERRIGGKRLPQSPSSDSSSPDGENAMIVSIPQELVQCVSTEDDRQSATPEKSNSASAIRKRRELQLLLDGDKPKNQWVSLQEIPVFQAEDPNSRQTRSNKLWGSSTRRITPVEHFNFSFGALNSKKNPPRKQLPVDTITPQAQPHSSPRDPSQPPPAKQPALSLPSPIMNSTSESTSPTAPNQSETLPPLPARSSHHPPPPPSPPKEMFFADLVAFDSRQQCLLVDGDYELVLRRCHENGHSDSHSSPLSWDSILRGKAHGNGDSSTPQSSSSCLILKLSLNWLGGPPKTRTEEARDVCRSLVQLNHEYKERLKLNDHDQRMSFSDSSAGPPQSMVFNFLYSKNMLQQTELKQHLTCPWCALVCPSSDAILHHMSLCHPRFLFNFSQSVEGPGTVSVCLNKMYNTESCSSSDPSEMLAGNLLRRRRRPTPCLASTAVLTTRNKSKELDFTGARQVPVQRPQLTRVFYHSQTCLPIFADEIEKDSEEDDAPEWLKTASKKMLDEFTDVNSGEKQFMKLWNCYLMEHRLIADKQLPAMCLQFASSMRTHLTSDSISGMFLSHLVYLCDTGLVSPACVTQCMDIVQQGQS